jgi:hypothetical protein
MEVRNALYFDQPVDDAWLAKISASLGVEHGTLEPFLGRSLRALYQQGICGGAILIGMGGAKIEVPMAFQSAMAGIMLAAEVVKLASGVAPQTVTTKLNLMRPLGALLSEKQEKDAGGNCFCQDVDYVAYRSKYDRRPCHESDLSEKV